MELKLILEHKNIFGKPTYSFDYLLKEMNKNLLVRIACYFIKGFYDDIYFFCTSGRFFSTPNSDLAYHLLIVLEYLNSLKPSVIFNTHSSLFFLEKILSMPNNNTIDKDSNLEINLLKAYLIINQDLVSREDKLLKKIETLEFKEKPAAYIFYQPLAYSDFVNYDYGLEVSTQTIKAIIFFRFCEIHLPIHLKLFCDKYERGTWKEYLKSYLFIPYNLLLNKGKEISVISLAKNNTDFRSQSLFLDRFCINNQDVLNDKDFTKLRAFPLYKENSTNYIVLFELFSAERIYRSLYFEFNAINNEINSVKKDGENRILNFRTFVTDEFSEKSILYELLDKIFDSGDSTNIKDTDYDPNFEGAPDYYVRKGNDIFLFESKDNLMNAEIKSSYDYDKITEDLNKKLNKKKGIKQICNSIDKILKKTLPIDLHYNKNTVNIYPILVLHERIYSNAGLNYILNNWFETKVKPIKDSIESSERIKSLVVIDIDTLILFQNVKQDVDFDFKTLMDNYYQRTEHVIIGELELNDEIKLKDAFLLKYFSFKDYIEPIIKKKVSEKGETTFLEEVVRDMFK